MYPEEAVLSGLFSRKGYLIQRLKGHSNRRTTLATLLYVKVVVFPRPAVELSPFAAQVREARHH